MKTLIHNTGYFFKEAKTIFKVDKGSNIFSIFSIGLILFILALIFSGWWISNEIIHVLQEEAEVSVYYDEDLADTDVSNLISKIEKISGIKQVNVIGERESYDRMASVLGSEADILTLFDANPFTAFIEVKIDINQTDEILNSMGKLEHIAYIRDNKSIIDKLKAITNMLTLASILIVIAVGISTVFVISHIIRQGIYNNRDQINTLRLLGAPNSFIGTPFLLEGLFLTLSGGLFASLLVSGLLYFGYEQINSSLLFIPLPSVESFIPLISALLMSISAALGILGSFFGFRTSINKG